MSKHHNLSTAAKRKRRAKLWELQLGRCAHCGLVLPAPDDGTLDHVVARSRGGGNGLRNLLLSCRACNEERRSRPELSARAEIYRARILDYCAAKGAGFGLSGAVGHLDPSGAERFPA